MKLEYRDLSRSSPEHTKRSKFYSPGFLDFLAASLLIFTVSAYLILPQQMVRVVDLVVYEPADNSYASFRCLRDKTTKHLFTQTRDVLELKSSVRVVRHADLDRYGRPQPDGRCFAAKGFVEEISRFEYVFGWLLRAAG